MRLRGEQMEERINERMTITVRELYEWAKNNGVENCTIRINMGSYGVIYHIRPEIAIEHNYDGTEYKEVVL